MTIYSGLPVKEIHNVIKNYPGTERTLEIAVTDSADAGTVALAACVGENCSVKSIAIKANVAAPTDLTNIQITAGTADTLLIDPATGSQAHLDAIGKTIAWVGVETLVVGEELTLTLTGTGSDSVDLLITINYTTSAPGGALV